jgi:hypothetical protein
MTQLKLFARMNLKTLCLSGLLLSGLNSALNAQVGIGTVTPASSSILDLTSTSKGMLAPRMTLAQKTAIVTPGTGLLIYQTDGVAGFWYYDGTAWQMLLPSSSGWLLTGNAGTVATTNFIGTTDAIDFATRTNNTEKMRVTSAGNVGIGTTSPTNMLSFSGQAARTIWMERNTTAATAGNSLTLQSSGAFSGGSNLNGGDLNLISGTSTGTGTSNIYFKTFPGTAAAAIDNTVATRMMIKGNGMVGLGTTTPLSNIHMYGTTNSGFTPSYPVGITAALGPEIAFSRGGFVNPGASIQMMDYNGYSSGLSFNVHKGTANGGTGVFADNWPLDIIQAMTIDNHGYVGIGTYDPKSTLDVKGTVHISGSTSGYVGFTVPAVAGGITYTLPSVDGSNGQVLSTNGSATLTWATASGNDWHLAGNTGTTPGTDFIGTTDAKDVIFKTNGTEKMRITSGGFVGIGTTTPNRALNAVMNNSGANVVTIQNTNNAGYSSTDYYDNSGALAATHGFGNSGTGGFFGSRAYFNSYNNDMVLTMNGAQYNVFIEGTNGNVGINTSSPTANLNVNGTFAITTATSGTANSVVLLASGSTFSTPAAAAGNAGMVYIIRNTGTTTNVTVNNVVDFNSGVAANYALTPALGSIMIVSDGAKWYRIK